MFRSPCSASGTRPRTWLFWTARPRTALIPHRERHARTPDGRGAAAEPRGRGVRARGDAALRDGDRRRHRDPRRVRLLPRARTARSTAPCLGLWAKGEPVDAITLANELEERGELEQVGGALPRRRARGARAGDGERRALRADRQGDGDAPRADPGRAGDRAARPGAARRDDRARRPRRADRLRPRRRQRVTGDFDAHRGRCSPRASSGSRSSTRRASDVTGVPCGLPRPRPAHVRLPAGQPGHPRGAPVDGEVGARALHRREPRRPHVDPGGALHARDVEGRGDAAADVQRGEGRVRPRPLRQAARRRTGRA